MFKAIVPNPDDEGVVLVRGVPFGGPQNRDVHGQFFTQNTNFLSHILPLPPLFHFHGAKSGNLADQIGETLSREQRSDGVWYKARLFIDSKTDAVKLKAVQLWEAAKAGLLYASSGAVEATIKVAPTGEIVQWLVGELSLIDTRNNRENPASFHATVIPIKCNLEGVDTGDVTVEGLSISVEQDNNGNGDNFVTEEDVRSMVQQIIGTNHNQDTRSGDMPDENANQELLTQMQQQMAQMQSQMAEMQAQNTNLQSDIQTRDGQIAELQGIVSTKSAEVAMGTHVGMVETWIKDGKVTPAEKDHVLEVLSFAYQADTTTKGDTGFVNAIKGWVEARPVNPVIGQPSSVYTNWNGSGTVEGPGGGVDQANIARLKRYAELPVT